MTSFARSPRRSRATECFVVELLARTVRCMSATLVMYRRGRQPLLDEFDAPPIDDRMLSRGGDGDGPTEMMSDPDAHSPF